MFSFLFDTLFLLFLWGFILLFYLMLLEVFDCFDTHSLILELHLDQVKIALYIEALLIFDIFLKF